MVYSLLIGRFARKLRDRRDERDGQVYLDAHGQEIPQPRQGSSSRLKQRAKEPLATQEAQTVPPNSQSIQNPVASTLPVVQNQQFYEQQTPFTAQTQPLGEPPPYSAVANQPATFPATSMSNQMQQPTTSLIRR